MRSIPLAMTWELLKHKPWSLIAGALGANALPVFILTALWQQGGGKIPSTDSSIIVMHVVVIQMIMFIFGAGVFAAQGSPARLYSWPIPTATIVTWHLLPAMAFTAVGSLLSTMLLNAVFNLGWPLWGPAMFVAVSTAAIQAVFWLTDKSIWVIAGMAIVAGVLGIWFKSRYGAPFSPPQHYWSQLNPSEVATMLVVALLAYGTAIVAVSRNRRGEPPISLGIIAWLNVILDPLPRNGRSFRTPTQAQFWFEWHQKGWAMPVGIVFGMLMGCCAWLIFSRDLEKLFGGFIVGGGMISAMGLVAGLIMGNYGPNDANYEMGPFLATRPMTTPAFVQTLLKVSALSVLVAWTIWAITFLILHVILLATGFHPGPKIWNEAGLGWWYFPATLVGAWLVVALGSLIGLAGRSSLFAELLAGPFVLFIVLQLSSKFLLSDQMQELLRYGAATLCGVASLMVTTWWFVVARRRVLIGWPTASAAFSVWGALTAMVAIVRIQYPTESLSIYVLLIGLAALAVAPLAAAPLALAWNRNR